MLRNIIVKNEVCEHKCNFDIILETVLSSLHSEPFQNIPRSSSRRS